MSPPFGSPYGLPQYGPPMIPPRRRRSPFRSLLLGLMITTLLAFGGLAVANTLSGTSDVAYQNDDYRVPPPDRTPPPLPLPETVSEAEQMIADSAFYNQSTPIPVRCNSQPVNVASASDSQLESHFEELMECLMRVWQPPVEAARFQIVRPTVTVYGSEITTRCGKSGVNAFYCAADQQVYFSNRLADAVEIVRQNKWAADVVMAHEFGHAIQGRTGILISAKALGQESGSKATDLELSRRLETQADCLSGMFMRAVSVSLGIQQSDLEGIQDTYVAVGDDVLTSNPDVVGNHGRAKSRRYWGTVGLGTSDVGKCNTFVAERSLVR